MTNKFIRQISILCESIKWWWSACTVRPLQMCCLCLLEQQIIVCLDHFLRPGVPRLSRQHSVYLGSAGVCLMFSLTCALLVWRPQGGLWTLVLRGSCTLLYMRPGEFNHMPCMGAKMSWWGTLVPRRRLGCICQLRGDSSVKSSATEFICIDNLGVSDSDKCNNVITRNNAEEICCIFYFY